MVFAGGSYAGDNLRSECLARGPAVLESLAPTDWFMKRRRKCLIASTLSEVRRLLKSRNFGLILSNYHLPDATGFALIDRFRDLPVSLFLPHRVEDGCIWLPTILHGVKGWGAASPKPRAFNGLLADSSRETRKFMAQTAINTLAKTKEQMK
jgi:hypothetical protein